MIDAIMILISMLCSFVMGVVVMLFAGRGFLIPHIKASKTGYLLRIHREDAITAYYAVAKIGKTGLLEYNDREGEKKVVSVVEGAVKRVGRVWVVDVEENSTAPFVYTKTVPFTEEVTDEQGNKRTITSFRAFSAYKDSSIISNALQWALMRPKRALGSDFDLKTILIVLLVVGVAVFLLMRFMSGDPAPVAPVANGVVNASNAVIA